MNSRYRSAGILSIALFIVIGINCLTGGCSWIGHTCIGLPKFTHHYEGHEEIMVEMRDGVKLSTDVYFPEGKGPWPVILIRSPYNAFNAMSYMAKVFAGYGYVGIHQDVRGAFDSEGEWFPVIHERDDGVDMLTWLVKQSWQDGNIAMFGGSYFGFTQMAVADMLPPEVKTLVPMVVGTDVRNMMSENGMFFTDVWMGWPALMHDGKVHLFNGRNFQKALKHLPAKDADEVYFGKRLDWFQEIIGGINETSSLLQREESRALREVPEKIEVPVLMVSAWYDLFAAVQLADFQRLGSRSKSRIIIGPWSHLLGIMGDGDKDLPGAGNILDNMPRILNWFDHHLRGGELEEWGPVEIYAIGDDRWETYDIWPPKTGTMRFYPCDTGRAHGCDGGRLTSRPSGTSEAISYTYDPLDPVPTKGGNSLLMFSLPGFGGEDPSSRDQKGLCERDDVITFVSDPLTEPLAIRGRVRVRLAVSSTAEDTAFTAKLIEVDPDGLALNIADGITRLAYRNGSGRALSYSPGQKIELNFQMHPVAWTVQPGYRLRLDISSSNFPAYHAHANRAGPWAEQKEPIKAEQTIHTGNIDTTYVELPIISER